MFKAPFSFEGRIRRSEFIISWFLQLASVFIVAALASASEALGIAGFVLAVWFGLAQGTKRCHDRGNPGIFMIIAFYGLWMVFAEGDRGDNQYGPSPKV